MGPWLVCLGSVASAALAMEANAEPERIMSMPELTQLERANDMWRQVQVAEEVPENLRRWRQAGYTAAEVAAAEPQLVEIWTVPAERNFGWLHEDTIEQIKAVDREFITQMRAVRLYEMMGVRPRGKPVPSAVEVNLRWRQAILKVLDYDEVSEFRLMNSVSARNVSQLTEGLVLTRGEQRMLFTWQREFDAVHGSNPLGSRPRSADHLEDYLEQWGLVRDLLGDERFAVYLGRADPEFEAMQLQLKPPVSLSRKEALDLWWLRKKFDLAKWRQRTTTTKFMQDLAEGYQSQVEELLGAARYDAYIGLETGRWLYPTNYGIKWAKR